MSAFGVLDKLLTASGAPYRHLDSSDEAAFGKVNIDGTHWIVTVVPSPTASAQEAKAGT